MSALTRRLEKLEAVTEPSSDPAIRKWLGMTLTTAEESWVEANPVEPMTAAEIESFDAWWHNPPPGEWPRLATEGQV